MLNLTTRANEPVVFGSWLKRGLHINAVGSNRASARELDTEAVRGSRVVVDLKTQACKEAGDLIGAAREGAFNWDDAAELAAVVAGTQPGRTREEEVTIFSSQGMGLWDVALAEIAYQRALAQGLGTRLPIPPTGGSFPSDSLSPL